MTLKNINNYKDALSSLINSDIIDIFYEYPRWCLE